MNNIGMLRYVFLFRDLKNDNVGIFVQVGCA